MRKMRHEQRRIVVMDGSVKLYKERIIDMITGLEEPEKLEIIYRFIRKYLS